MFQPTNMIRIAADTVQELRRCDVFRCLDWYADMRQEFGEWIAANRPDLADEVADCLAELNA